VSIAALTILAVGVLARAAPLPLEDAGGEGGRVARLAQVMSIASVSTFLAVFVSVYAQRVEGLRQESARNEKLALLGRLVGAMSHELSTPLATVLLASNELVEITRESGHKDIERLTKTLAGEAQRASDIIGVVRGHIRPDLQRERVELVSFVRELADAELDRLGFRGRRELWAPEPVTALVLKPALRQVLVNLLTNAAEACARRDQDPRIAISVTRFGDVAEVTVADSGPGFSDDILPRLGEPFQSTKEEQGGMGLGLYVCSMLARRMNAVLRAESAEDGGARVTLSMLLGSVSTAEEAQRS
jgi:two-component system sensor histidine kinase RegB